LAREEKNNWGQQIDDGLISRHGNARHKTSGLQPVGLISRHGNARHETSGLQPVGLISRHGNARHETSGLQPVLYEEQKV